MGVHPSTMQTMLEIHLTLGSNMQELEEGRACGHCLSRVLLLLFWSSFHTQGTCILAW